MVTRILRDDPGKSTMHNVCHLDPSTGTSADSNSETSNHSEFIMGQSYRF
jgi:hypothetical protein